MIPRGAVSRPRATEAFRASFQGGRELRAQLRRRLAGLCSSAKCHDAAAAGTGSHGAADIQN